MLRIPILCTSLVILYFFFFMPFGLTEIEKLRPNEFGDLISGAVSAISVVWLVSSAINQQKESAAQREDIEETKRANIIQGQALQAATKIEAIRHLRELQQARMEHFSKLLDNFRKMLHRNLEEQNSAVAYLAWKDDFRKPIFEFYLQIIRVTEVEFSEIQIKNPVPELIRSDISHEETVCALDIYGYINDLEKAVKFLRERSVELDIKSSQAEWESTLGLDNLLPLKLLAKSYAECAIETYSLNNQTVAANFLSMTVDGKLAKGDALAMSWRVVSGDAVGTVAERGRNVFPPE